MSSSFCSHSFSTESPSLSQDHSFHQGQGEGETTVARDNSFEDLEQFLSHLNYTPPEDRTEENRLHPEPQSPQSDQRDVQIQELEMRALKDHLKAIVKDIHIAIGKLPGLKGKNTSQCKYTNYIMFYVVILDTLDDGEFLLPFF